MDRITAMQVFTEVADRASLTDAAGALDMSRAMVSRYLESLERWLGVRLLHRTTRRVSLTDAGEEALPRCRQMLDLSRDLQSVAGARHAAPSGKLRITTSTSFAVAYLADVVTDFLSRYPQTQVELIATERAVNLVEERIDLAVRIGNVLDDSLVARRLGACRSVVCASPAYIEASGCPGVPDDLRHHRCITHATVGRTDFRFRQNGQTLRIPVRGQLQSNEAAVTRRAALAGAGIAMLPTYFVSADLACGALVRLLPDCEPEPLGIHAVYLSRQHQPQLLRTMVDFLADRMRGEVSPWDRVIASSTKQTTSAARSRVGADGTRRRRPKAS
jgi:DNA-binding transcriptional LysR family regulator